MAVAVRHELGDGLHEREARAQDPRLLVRLLREPAAADPAREAEEVAYQRARAGLTADPGLVDNHRPQPLGGGVDRRGEPGRSRADDQHVELILVASRGRAAGPRQLEIGGIRECLPVGHDDHRQGPVRRHFGEYGGSLGRVGEREAVGIGAALENRAKLVSPPRPRVAHDADRMRRNALVLRPLEQEARDRLVEGLVRRLERTDEVVIDMPVDGRLGDRVARGRIAPLPPADEERALRVRMQVPRVGQELRAAPTGQNLRRQHERHRCLVLGERPESRACLLRRGEAHDVVVARVPLEELALDGAQPGCVPVDGEQHGPAHGCGC